MCVPNERIRVAKKSAGHYTRSGNFEATMHVSQEITVVSGLPRSGTSLMMQMLEAGGVQLLRDEERGADADNPRGYFEYAPVKRSLHDVSWLNAAKGRAVKVVVPLLAQLPTAPCYRVLLLRRDLNEVLASQRAMLERVGALPDELGDERLLEIFDVSLREAREWCREHARWRCVDYAELLENPKGAAEGIAEFLGGELDASAMSRCIDAALYRQRAGSSNRVDRGAAKHPGRGDRSPAKHPRRGDRPLG